MFYKQYFKNLLNESPDKVIFNNRSFHWYNCGVNTFIIYNDVISLKQEWVGVSYNKSRENILDITSSNEEITEELKFIFGLSKNNTDSLKLKISSRYLEINIFLHKLNDFFEDIVHGAIIDALKILKRTNDHYDDTFKGRILDVDNKGYVLSFWHIKEEVNKYKKFIIDYIHSVYLNPKDIWYQTEDMYNDQFITFEELFNETPSNALSDEEKKIKQLERDLHMKKGQLDKAILDIIATKPENVNDLYTQLEKQFNMPVVKIKYMFDKYGIGLDKVLSRKLHEFIKRKKSFISV